MAGLINHLKRTSEFVGASIAPVETDGARDIPDVLTRSLEDLDETVRRGMPVSLDDVGPFIDAVKNLTGIGLDDREYLLEKLLVFMSRSPDDSEASQKVQEFVIDILYKDLPHPPIGYLSMAENPSPVTAGGTSVNLKYAARSADGSNYNPLFPKLGQAGRPYARSVPSTNLTPISALPDPGLVFDTLLRRDKFVEHPGGISSLFFAFADLVIHSIFNTNNRDWMINDSSSYLDLSPLYGSNQNDVNRVRRKDGTGRLWDDVFADGRLMLMPPSVCALLVLLSRNHNYIAQKILAINERKTFKWPPPSDAKEFEAQDDEIFQRSRLVNTAYFMQIILGDYVGAILGLARDGLSWRLKPLQQLRDSNHEFSPRGEGNVVAIEFNLMYRWHATLSRDDTKWTEAEFTRLFEGRDPATLNEKDFLDAVRKNLNPGPDVKKWTFDGLERSEDGRFHDSDLARIIQSATGAYAGAFKARGTPAAMRVIEILGIEQARAWGTCSLNEFRSFIGLRPYRSFRDWNSDEDIHTAAEALYHNIDNLELHVGLQAEEAKPAIPGSGLCPGYTISRAILADAVCLSRGDRFFTVDFTPFNLTSWGWQDCQYDPSDGSYGGLLTKLLFRTLPDHYPTRSAYAHFPFMVPGYMKNALDKLPNTPVAKYSFERPIAPYGLAVLNSRADVNQVLRDTQGFASVYRSRMGLLVHGVTRDRAFIDRVLFSESQVLIWQKAFRQRVGQFVRDKSIERIGSPGRYVDIIRDVIKLLPVHWIANDVIGLPMKNKQNDRGVYREKDLDKKLGDICDYIFLNNDPSEDWALRERSAESSNMMVGYLKTHFARFSGSMLSWVTDSAVHALASKNDNSDLFLRKVAESSNKKHTEKQLAASLFGEVISSIAYYGQALALVVDFYLKAEQATEREHLVHLSNDHLEAARPQILDYIYRALKTTPPVFGLMRRAKSDIVIGELEIPADSRVFLSVVNANSDPSPGDDIICGSGDDGLLSSSLFKATAPDVIAAIFSLKNLRRGPGASGKLNSFSQEVNGTGFTQYIDSAGEITPWAPSLIVQYD